MFQELTHSAALSPVAGPSSGTSTAQRGESRGAVAPESHDRSSVPPGGQDQSMEQQSGNHVWGHVAHQRPDPAEQGYLAPPINYNNNNNYPDEQEEQALSEPCSSASGGQGSAIESHHGEEGGQEVGVCSVHQEIQHIFQVADLVVYRETGSHLSEADSKVQYLGGVK